VRFTQYYLDCLSHASYLVADETTKRAAVVDPKRDIQEYLDDAAAEGLRIEYVIETHFHADFLSGHLELAEATGAQIIYGSAANPQYPIRKVVDGERLTLGPEDGSGVVLEFWETPGHTPESISVVIWEHGDDPEPFGVLTGDTLFIGDVGRPDLLASAGVSAEDLARALYVSVHDKLLSLPNSTRVFPAHGAGSACGKSLSTETVSTMGEQRRTNYALQPMTVDEFIAAVTEGQSAAPAYFSYDAGLNKRERELLDINPPEPLDLDRVLTEQAAGAVVVDTRAATDFAAGHLARSINVGLDGRFAESVGAVVSPGTPIVLVGDPGTEREAKLRLGRIGFDNVIGALRDGPAALLSRPEVVARSSRLTAAQLQERQADTAVQLVDVRNPGETALGTLPGARQIPLAQLRDRADELDFDTPIVVYCAGGYRSSIAASLLRSLGAKDVSDLIGGYGAWLSARRSSA
jgi:glyoxylase-like metal-dependent hydrolase (beta-lactamase superfamily II)/rhodanese-related sulfurtransferase